MQDRNGRYIMLVKQNNVSQWKTTTWFHIIKNFFVVHDKHDRANRSDIADTSNRPGDLGLFEDISFVTALIVLLIVTLFTGCAFKILKWETWQVAVLRVSHQLTRILLHRSYAHDNTITPDLLSFSVHVTLSERKGSCMCADNFCKTTGTAIQCGVK